MRYRTCPDCGEEVFGELKGFAAHRNSHAIKAPTASQTRLHEVQHETERELKRLRRLVSVQKAQIENLKKIAFAKGDPFYSSRNWLSLRFRTLEEHYRKYGYRCMLCNNVGGEFHVDHIKPRSQFPHLALDRSNLQVLCSKCNLGKSNKSATKYKK